MALSVGSMAPDFTLLSRRGSENVSVTLSQHRGKPVLLLFFPLAFTPT